DEIQRHMVPLLACVGPGRRSGAAVGGTETRSPRRHRRRHAHFNPWKFLAHAARLSLTVGLSEASKSACPVRPSLPERLSPAGTASLCADRKPSQNETNRLACSVHGNTLRAPMNLATVPAGAWCGTRIPPLPEKQQVPS